MKKVVLCFMTLALLIGLSCMVMSATDVGVTLTLSEADAGRGDTFTMTVNISGDSKMKSAMVLADFDSEVLELVSGEWLIDGTIENFSPEDKGGFFAAEGELDTQGDIFRFTFRVKDAAAFDSTSISCTVDLKNGTDSLPLGTISPVSLTVTCDHTYGEWEKYSETQHQHVCSKCGNVEYENHIWDDGIVTTDPTSTSQGVKTYTCETCGETKTEVVFAEDAPQIIVESQTVTAGDVVELNVNLKNNPGVISMSLTLEFDDTALKLVEVVDGGILGNNNSSPQLGNPYLLVWDNDTAPQNFTEDGVLVTLKFEVLETAEIGIYPVTISYDYDNYDIYNYDVEKVEFGIKNGGAEVIDYILGDVNGDNLVNNLDRLSLARYLARWAEYPESILNMKAADVNCDGIVNNLDRLILSRHLAKWEGYSSLPYEN